MDIDYSRFFPIKDYYEKVVMPLDKKFRHTRKGKFVCCLHDDTDPSLGIIKSKKKGEIYHCFGCNSWGDIINFHKRVSLKYFGRRLDDELCKRELCNIFGIDYAILPKEEYVIENVRDKDIRKELAMRDALGKYNIADFREDIITGKMEGKGIGFFNTILIKMVAEVKKD
ncbi:CHC2 zinc finger domain-containing protein [Clostridium baratii]